MRIKKLRKLLFDIPEGGNQLKRAGISSNGYTFIFRDLCSSREPYVVTKFSSKFSSAGVWRGFILKAMEDIRNFKLDDPSLNDVKYDMLLAGALKTLLPSLNFGGEIFFQVWILVRTASDQIFPATFYYGQSGTSLGGWTLAKAKKVFPLNFFALINFSPFDFTNDELNLFIEAFELSLRGVYVSDFHGIFECDEGYSLMGVRKGEPFIEDLGYSYDDDKVASFLKMFDTLTDLKSC